MTAIEQLLQDAMTTHTDGVPHLRPGAARAALRSSHRTSRVRLAAASTATVAATAGVGVFVVSLQPASTGTFVSGAAGSGGPAVPKASATGAAATGAAAKSAKRVPAKVLGAVADPASATSAQEDASEVEKTAAESPADLVAVTIANQVAGLDLAERANMYALTVSGKWRKYIFFNHPGNNWSSGCIILTKGASTPIWNVRQSPSPSTSSVTVAGHPATNWVSGGDHYVVFSAGQITVEVFASDKAITTDQLVALADALQGLPQ